MAEREQDLQDELPESQDHEDNSDESEFSEFDQKVLKLLGREGSYVPRLELHQLRGGSDDGKFFMVGRMNP